jgi:hypothetical membrane protein
LFCGSSGEIQLKRSFFGLCGIVGPIWFSILLLIVGSLHPEYNHVTQYISELGARSAPYSVIMNFGGFMLLGLLITLFSYGFRSSIRNGRWSTIGTSLLTVSGIGFIAIGLFPCDPGCITVSITGFMHEFAALVTWISMMLALVFIFQSMKNDWRWTHYRSYTLLTTILILIISGPLLFFRISGWVGMIQRVFIGVRLLWIEITAIQLFRLSARTRQMNS